MSVAKRLPCLMVIGNRKSGLLIMLS